jgi:hypothetical protein
MIYAATAVYNRSSKQYDVSIREEQHPVLDGKTINFDDPRRAIGMIVAGQFLENTKPAVKVAVLNALFAKCGSGVRVDDTSFSNPIITL